MTDVILQKHPHVTIISLLLTHEPTVFVECSEMIPFSSQLIKYWHFVTDLRVWCWCTRHPFASVYTVWPLRLLHCKATHDNMRHSRQLVPTPCEWHTHDPDPQPTSHPDHLWFCVIQVWTGNSGRCLDLILQTLSNAPWGNKVGMSFRHKWSYLGAAVETSIMAGPRTMSGFTSTKHISSQF